MRCVDIADQRDHCLPKRIAIPLADTGLHSVRVAALLVSVIADVRRVIGFHESEGAIVERDAEYRHVVRVEHAVHESHGLPVGDQFSGAVCDLAQQRLIGMSLVAKLRVALRQHIVCQRLQLIRVLMIEPMLERTETHEAWRHARDHCGGLGQFAHYAQIRTDHAQRTGSRYAKPGHGF